MCRHSIRPQGAKSIDIAQHAGAQIIVNFQGSTLLSAFPTAGLTSIARWLCWWGVQHRRAALYSSTSGGMPAALAAFNTCTKDKVLISMGSGQRQGGCRR